MIRKKTLVWIAVLLAIVAIIAVLIITAPQKITVGIYQIHEHETLDIATLGFIDQMEEEFGEDNVTWVRDFKATYGDTATGYSIVEKMFKNQGVELVLVNSTEGLKAANTSRENRLPVVAIAITDYAEALGLTNFNGVVGGNITGTSDLASPEEQVAMMMEICALMPELAENGTRSIKVGIVHNTDEAASNYEVREVEKYLAENGFEYQEYRVVSSHDVGEKVQQAVEECDVLYLPFDHTVAESAATVESVVKGAIADGKKIPVFTSNENICKECGLVALSVDYYEMGRATARMAAKILRGEADISTMEVEHAEAAKKYNKEMAALLGLTLPTDYAEIK